MNGLPRWVAVKGDPHGGVIHEGADGYWRANNWQGCLGGYASESEAELAIMTAPPAPKRKRLAKQEPPEALKDWTSLTDSESGFIVRDEHGLAIGGVKPSGGRFAAWFKSASVGEFDTPGQGKSAVYAAHRVAKKRRRP